jgi:hypothetical protein
VEVEPTSSKDLSTLTLTARVTEEATRLTLRLMATARPGQEITPRPRETHDQDTALIAKDMKKRKWASTGGSRILRFRIRATNLRSRRRLFMMTGETTDTDARAEITSIVTFNHHSKITSISSKIQIKKAVLTILEEMAEVSLPDKEVPYKININSVGPMTRKTSL